MTAYLGYLATLFLALSLLVSNDLQFRWFNTLGCLSFIVYGAAIGAFPVILTNTILLVINAWHLFKVYRYRTEEDFELVPFATGDPLVQKFRSFYKKDLDAYFPGFEESAGHNLRFLVLRDMGIANLFVATVEEDGTALVRVNYTVPKYRDYKVGRFLFDKGRNFLLRQNVRRVVYDSVTHANHADFLRKMGFTSPDGKRYVKELG
ncbi:hypothetical protein [Flaviaesturariibacter amylovorans]|uniref:N-acetyltransferase domain-containing protein n=1 Tax=Flaviaesturariibacter amylovorans TaxID=1084520 RepID=A0ABP8HNH3_9BACT